jgi:hypothetical protein
MINEIKYIFIKLKISLYTQKQEHFSPENGGSMFLQFIGIYIQIHATL